MKTGLGFEPGSMKFILPVFFALGSLNILFLQSRQLFNVVAFPGIILGELVGITDVMPFFEQASIAFVVSLLFYFVLGVVIDFVWLSFIKRNAKKAQKKDPA